MRAPIASAAAGALLLTASAASAQTSLADYRRAVACFAITEKMAIENERGWKSFAEVARRDPDYASKLEDMRAEQEQNIQMKRAIAGILQRNAATLLNERYEAWAAEEALPPKPELERRELDAARREAAKASNIDALSGMMDGKGCEDFLVTEAKTG